MSTNDPQIEVIIEFDQFIAGRELSEIIEVLDEALWYEIDDRFFPPFFPFRYRFYQEPLPPLFCIAEVDKGSITLIGVLTGAAATYCYQRFKKGFRRSRFGDEMEHLGNALGNRLGEIVDRMNQWLGDYTEEAQSKKSNIKRIKVRQKRPKGERESNE